MCCRYARHMVQYVSCGVDNRFLYNLNKSDSMSEESRTLIDLALENYLAKQTHYEATFKPAGICQIRTFLFAGHDTSNSTLCYCYHLPSLHPQIRSRLVEEHNRFLNPGLDQKARQIAVKTLTS